jgi:hypothetical protein
MTDGAARAGMGRRLEINITIRLRGRILFIFIPILENILNQE